MTEYALIGDAECALEEVVEHAVTGERVCIVATPNGSRRYVAEDEWRAGVRRFISHTREHGIVTSQSSSMDKIALFRSLFRGRTDVFARGYLGRDNKIRYGPVCSYERDKPVSALDACEAWSQVLRLPQS